jgi:mono/diheme cytochrome c family protein
VSRGARALILVLALAAAGFAAGAAFLAARRGWEHAALDTPVQRGRAIARRMGCFGCHGEGGGQPIRNPGSKEGDVPGWTGGTWMMWNNDEADVRAWILDGHPAHREADAAALIKMPAFASRLTRKDAADLVAYVLAASQFGPIADPRADAGHEVASKLGCFGCHGAEGRGLVMNPGSLKGYIPPWDGADYADLVHGESELGEWVREGSCARLRANPIARRFMNGQAIAMPAYHDRVSDDDLGALSAYIAWVRAHPRTGAAPPSAP